MYTIEYNKTKKEKPTIKQPEYSSDNKRRNYMMRRRYLHQKDLINKCWNIKSLTIDIEDIKHIIQDRRLQYLFSLYERVKRANFDESINSITILNNNRINLLYIYEIIKCEWIVNANDDLNNLDVLKITRRLLTLMDRYDREREQKKKRIIKDEIELIKYYMDTIINKHNYNNNKETDTKTLKLGRHFIRRKNWTIH